MPPPQISQFLEDCIIKDDTNDSGLNADTFYGLYVSWCSLNRKVPSPTMPSALPSGLRASRRKRTAKARRASSKACA